MPRFASVWPRLGIWALPVLGILITAPAAQAALVGYDIVFTCETRCSVIGDEPTGMLFFDDSALLTDGWKQSRLDELLPHRWEEMHGHSSSR